MNCFNQDYSPVSDLRNSCCQHCTGFYFPDGLSTVIARSVTTATICCKQLLSSLKSIHCLCRSYGFFFQRELGAIKPQTCDAQKTKSINCQGTLGFPSCFTSIDESNK